MNTVTKTTICAPALIAILLFAASCNSRELYYDPYKLQLWADSLSLYMGKSVYNEGDTFTLYDKNSNPASFIIKSIIEDGANIASGFKYSKYKGEINSKILQLEIISNDHTLSITVSKVENKTPTTTIIWDNNSLPSEHYLPTELDFSKTKLNIADKMGNAAILELGTGISYLLNAENQEEWSLQAITESTK